VLEGSATPEGTLRFRERSVRERSIPSGHFRRGPLGHFHSSIGLGTYLGRPDAATDRAVEEAVAISLRSGRINVIDTAINYRHQRAERSVGRSLAHLNEQGLLRRDEVFVATKVGYLAPDGESGLPPDRWIQEQLVDRGVVAPEEMVDGVHSMAPGYLDDQIDRSRKNLGLETLDLLYLHNAADAQLPSLGPEEFLHRLWQAFERLELRRAQGHLAAYGLATWDALRAPRDDPVHLDLGAIMELAQEVGGATHGFRFVQFPFNSSMPEALERSNQRVDGKLMPLFGAAAALGIGCFTSVPLLQGQLAAGPGSGKLTAAQTALQYARSAPGNLAALVGTKSPAHLSEDLGVADVEPEFVPLPRH
jgi:aryl-alcohol dehydrogenase-like predicted oxidoreductase